MVINKVVTCHHPDSDKCSHFFCYSVSSSEIRWALHLHYDPVEAGFVWKAEDHCYNPAFDYAGGKGYLDVDLIQ